MTSAFDEMIEEERNAFRDAFDNDIRERLAALPDATLRLDGYFVGECSVAIVDADLPTEHAVVLMAAPHVEATCELVNDWLAGASAHVEVDGNVFRFGTAGEGEGRVAYEITDVADHERDVVLLRRLS